MQKERMQFSSANARRPPFVLKGDTISSSTFWHGKLLNQWANDWMKYHTDGQGNYVIRELGPARAADGIGDTVPPVLELGTVVWQGFSPGRRELAARLTLDPTIEGVAERHADALRLARPTPL